MLSVVAEFREVTLKGNKPTYQQIVTMSGVKENNKEKHHPKNYH